MINEVTRRRCSSIWLCEWMHASRWFGCTRQSCTLDWCKSSAYAIHQCRCWSYSLSRPSRWTQQEWTPARWHRSPPGLTLSSLMTWWLGGTTMGSVSGHNFTNPESSVTKDEHYPTLQLASDMRAWCPSPQNRRLHMEQSPPQILLPFRSGPLTQYRAAPPPRGVLLGLVGIVFVDHCSRHFSKFSFHCSTIFRS